MFFIRYRNLLKRTDGCYKVHGVVTNSGEWIEVTEFFLDGSTKLAEIKP